MTLSGRGLWTLNVLRACSIISLIMAIVASWATLVKSFVVTRFYFFDAINEVLLSMVCVFMLLSECSVAEAYFTKHWPLFSRRSSLVSLGIAEVMIGFTLLGHLNEGFASKQNLGNAFHSLLLSTGVIISFIGVCNFIASFVYRETSTGRTARMMRSFTYKEPELPSNSPAMDYKMRSPSPVTDYKTRSASPASTYNNAPYPMGYRGELGSPTPPTSVSACDHDCDHEHSRERDSELGDLGGYRQHLAVPERMYSHRTFRTAGMKSDTSSVYSRTVNGTSLYDPKDRI
ncbi:hypothetical protein EDC01DRAFT_662632 [Geopyxis carbonaria]|nr:hypothetical protein EDC01DRAFT_662632 [Geopyxis carbonaria]